MMIKNIYCVGSNYMPVGQILQNAPASPYLFSKPSYALAEAKGQELVLPGDRGPLYYEAELVFRIGRSYEKGIKADDIIDGMTVGLDFTLKGVQDEFKKKGWPWLLSKGFPNSAVLGKFLDFPGVDELEKLDFALLKNGVQVQQGNIKNTIFDLQTIIDVTGRQLGLGPGDILFTGTPEGAGPVSDGDRLTLLFEQKNLGDCLIRLEPR